MTIEEEAMTIQRNIIFSPHHGGRKLHPLTSCSSLKELPPHLHLHVHHRNVPFHYSGRDSDKVTRQKRAAHEGEVSAADQ